jgi:hypothetical protein
MNTRDQVTMPNPVAEVVERLREAATATSNIHKYLADSQSDRNRASGDEGACYQFLAREQTLEWQAADLIERLSRERDGFEKQAVDIGRAYGTLARERDTGVPEGIPDEPVRVRLDSSEMKFGECDFCYQRKNLGSDAHGDLMCGSCADANYLGEMTAYARQLRAMLSAAPQPPTVSPDIVALTRERDQAREALRAAREFVVKALAELVELDDFDPSEHHLIKQIDTALSAAPAPEAPT